MCFVTNIILVDWMSACVVPMYKDKGNIYERVSFRDISMLNLVGKVYGRVLIKRIREVTEYFICWEQCGF